MWLCARSAEQHETHGSRSENMRKVCLFFSQNNKIVIFINMADIFGEIHEVRKGFWAFFLSVDWLVVGC